MRAETRLRPFYLETIHMRMHIIQSLPRRVTPPWGLTTDRTDLAPLVSAEFALFRAAVIHFAASFVR